MPQNPIDFVIVVEESKKEAGRNRRRKNGHVIIWCCVGRLGASSLLLSLLPYPFASWLSSPHFLVFFALFYHENKAASCSLYARRTFAVLFEAAGTLRPQAQSSLCRQLVLQLDIPHTRTFTPAGTPDDDVAIQERLLSSYDSKRLSWRQAARHQVCRASGVRWSAVQPVQTA